MTRSDLHEVIYRFYPRGLSVGTEAYNHTEERDRQRDVARRAVASYPTWEAMLRRLGERYEVMNCSGHVLRAGYVEDGYDAGYSAHVDLPGQTLGFHVSLLGPYYGIHRLSVPGEESVALDLGREIEATYPGYEEIPAGLGDEVVPDVVDLGRKTIYVCLLSELWSWSSGAAGAPEGAEAPDDGGDPRFEGMTQHLEGVRQCVPKAPDSGTEEERPPRSSRG